MDSMIYKKKWPLWVFLTPAFFFMLVFLFYPFVLNVYNSFFDLNNIADIPNPEDFSLQYYARLLSDERMVTSLVNTFKLMGLTIVFQVGLALLLALFVDSIRTGAQFFRTVFFLPIVISATAIGLLFTLFYVPDGAINQLLMKLGLVEWGVNEIYFLYGDAAFYSLCVPTIWQYIGFYFVILLTGLSNISDDVVEAAAIDGATGIQRIRFITLPLLYNVLTTCLMLAITGSLKVFDMFWTILPNGMSDTFVTGTYMYFVTDMQKLVSYGATIANVIVLLGVVIAQICNLLFKPRDY